MAANLREARGEERDVSWEWTTEWPTGGPRVNKFYVRAGAALIALGLIGLAVELIRRID